MPMPSGVLPAKENITSGALSVSEVTAIGSVGVHA
jgi:hypothetical protein